MKTAKEAKWDSEQYVAKENRCAAERRKYYHIPVDHRETEYQNDPRLSHHPHHRAGNLNNNFAGGNRQFQHGENRDFIDNRSVKDRPVRPKVLICEALSTPPIGNK